MLRTPSIDSRGDGAITRTLLVALTVSVAGSLPGFLFGAVAVVIRPDLHFSIPAIGLGMATFFLGSAISCPVFGRITERIGWLAGMRIVALGSGVVLLLMGAVPQSYGPMLVLLAVAGIIQGFASPSVNVFMTERISEERQGLAFGMKQASIPGALLLSGISLPGIALTLGWRSVFFFGAAVAALGLLLTIRSRSAPRRGESGVSSIPKVKRRAEDNDEHGRRTHLPNESGRSLVYLTVGGALGSFAAHSMGSFLVPTSIAAGIGTGAAGLLLSAGSVLSLLVRLGAGWIADRRDNRSLRPIGLMVAIGSLGVFLLAAGVPVLVIVGSTVAFAAGWGWSGLLHLAVVTRNPDAPAAATGLAQSGIYWGAALAPFLFGAILDRFSYAVAWSVSGAVTVFAAVLILLADNRSRSARAATIVS